MGEGKFANGPGDMTKDFKEIFLKLAANDRSDKMFLLTSKFHPQGVVSPSSGLCT